MRPKDPLQLFDIDRLLPLAIRTGDGETLRKARIAIYFTMALQVMCTVYVPTFALAGRPLPAVVLGVGGVLLCTLPLTLRAPRPLFWAGMQIGALTLGALTTTAYYSGGLHSPSLWWMCITPVVAMLVSGKRLAVFMAAAQVTIVSLFHLANRAGHAWPTGRDPMSKPEIVFKAIVLLMATLLALAWLFEKAKERTLAALSAHNRELRLILDNVGQGFLCADPAGRLIGHHSAIVETWFGPIPEGAKIWEHLGRGDGRFSSLLMLGWTALGDGFLPLELIVDQLPRRFSAEGRVFCVEYRPIADGETLSTMVIVISDVTALTVVEAAEAEQRELADSLDRALRDRAGFIQFIEEGDALIAELDPRSPDLKRVVHTLKGNCGFFGARSVAAASHALEENMADGGVDAADLERLAALWRRFRERLSLILDARAGIVEVSVDDYAALARAVERGASHVELARMIAELRFEPVAVALGRSAEQARSLALRLGKGEIDVEVDACNVRLDPAQWRSLWSAFVHAIRNSVDHGLEPPEERVAAGKPAAGSLRLSAASADHELVITITDDGRGIDWQRIRERARAAAIAHETAAELEAALFVEGISTRSRATESSGRGVGMAALRAAVAELGGQIELCSASGRGTTLSLRFPKVTPSARDQLGAERSLTRSIRCRADLVPARSSCP